MRIFVNYKNNKTKDEFIEDIKVLNEYKDKVTLFPASCFYHLFDGFNIGSQNISSVGSVCTGEISARQLKSCGVRSVLIGHSERRKKSMDDNVCLIDKVKVSLENDFEVLFCVGEREKANLKDTLFCINEQISSVFDKAGINDNVIIAYEPNWAIGKGENVEINYITDVVNFIKKYIKNKYDINIKVIYGGGVSYDFYKDLSGLEILDGVLLSSASLNVKELVKFLC